MNAYQNFLDFFSMHNKERLDGLSESYFTVMTPDEKTKAFDFLLNRIEINGGGEESVHGIFRADCARAVQSIKKLMAVGKLNEEAQIAAAWNIWNIEADDGILKIFLHFMASTKVQLREKAVYYLPAKFTTEIKASLQGMIRTETERLVSVHAVNKLLDCYGVTKESVGDAEYMVIYKGLRSNDLKEKELAFKRLDKLYA